MIKITYSASHECFFVNRVPGFGAKAVTVMLADYQKTPPEIPFLSDSLESAIDRALYAIKCGEILKIGNHIINLDTEIGASLGIMFGDGIELRTSSVTDAAKMIAARLSEKSLAVGFEHPIRDELIFGRETKFVSREEAQDFDLTGYGKITLCHHNLDGKTGEDLLLTALKNRMPLGVNFVVYAYDETGVARFAESD